MAKTKDKPQGIRVFVLYQSQRSWYFGGLARSREMLELLMWDYICMAERVAYTTSRELAQACSSGLGPRKFQQAANGTKVKFYKGVPIDDLPIPPGAVALVGARSGGFPFNYWRLSDGLIEPGGLTAKQQRCLVKQREARKAVPGAGMGRGNIDFPKDIPLRQPKALQAVQ